MKGKQGATASTASVARRTSRPEAPARSWAFERAAVWSGTLTVSAGVDNRIDGPRPALGTGAMTGRNVAHTAGTGQAGTTAAPLFRRFPRL
jgi:hypothetical protein